MKVIAGLLSAMLLLGGSAGAGSLVSAPAPAVTWLPPGVPGVVSSSNVEYHGTIPLEVPSVGGEVVDRPDLGGKRYFYTTGARGLYIYDVTEPAVPVLTGHLFLPHYQNEDLKVSDDGTRAVIAADGRGGGYDVFPFTTGLHVVDTTDPSLPRVVASSSELVGGTGTAEGIPEHTVECADEACTILYGRTGRIYEVAEPVVTPIGEWHRFGGGTAVRIHALNRDESGLIVSDSVPRLVLDPREDPKDPVVVAIGYHDEEADPHLQHNNVRTGALDWEPRDPEDEVEYRTVDAGVLPDHNISIVDERPVMRPGELLIAASETILNTSCESPSGFSTWSMVNFDRGAELQQLEVFRPTSGNWLDSRPAFNVLGCSPHWFTVSEDVVAAGWFEHGVRFFRVDRSIGTIEEIGWFQPVWTSASAAYWIDDEFVYSVDYARGIDILRFDRDAEPPSPAALQASWLRNTLAGPPASIADRFSCQLAAQ